MLKDSLALPKLRSLLNNIELVHVGLGEVEGQLQSVESRQEALEKAIASLNAQVAAIAPLQDAVNRVVWAAPPAPLDHFGAGADGLPRLDGVVTTYQPLTGVTGFWGPARACVLRSIRQTPTSPTSSHHSTVKRFTGA